MSDLGDLGLSEYEARTYRTLLERSPTTAQELSEASGVPTGRIYDVLADLERRGFVRCQATGRPKRYVAVEPDAALDALLETRREELAAEADRYEAAVEELRAELDPADPVDDRFWTVAVGPKESLDLVVERHRAAEDRIRFVVGDPSPQLDVGRAGERVIGALEAALDRGVSVSILSTDELAASLPDALLDSYLERLASHPDFAARTLPEVAGTFNLIDRAEVCIEVQNPLDPDHTFATVDLKDPSFAAAVRRTFQERWERATPLSL